MSKKIEKVCDDCGRAANFLTCYRKYKEPPKQAKFQSSTFSVAKCDFCKRKTAVTEPRDYFYPDFSLLQAAVDQARYGDKPW